MFWGFEVLAAQNLKKISMCINTSQNNPKNTGIRFCQLYLDLIFNIIQDLIFYSIWENCNSLIYSLQIENISLLIGPYRVSTFLAEQIDALHVA